jgi:hypothetical protein
MIIQKSGRRVAASLLLGFLIGLGLTPLSTKPRHELSASLASSFATQAQDSGGRRHFGVNGCMSSSCHGGSRGPRGQSQGDEALIWSRKDPHSKSHARLFEDTATELVTAYNEANEKTPIRDAGSDPRCLRCHSDFVPPAERGPGFDIERGVTCEACHGPSEGWRDKHHLGGMSQESMLAAGRKDLRSLWQRADLCLTCHLAAPPELVAAGHPELGMDLYRGVLDQPQHWSESHELDGLRSTLAGAAVAAAKHLEGLAGADLNLAAASAERALAWLWLLRFAPALDKDLSSALSDDGIPGQLRTYADMKAPERAALKKSAAGLSTKIAVWGRAVAQDTALSRESFLKFGADLAAGVAARLALSPLEAELASGAALATYHALSFGSGPRKLRKYKIPPAFKAISLSRTRYEPEDLWTDEGDLKLEDFKARFAKAAALLK